MSDRINNGKIMFGKTVCTLWVFTTSFYVWNKFVHFSNFSRVFRQKIKFKQNKYLKKTFTYSNTVVDIFWVIALFFVVVIQLQHTYFYNILVCIKVLYNFFFNFGGWGGAALSAPPPGYATECSLRYIPPDIKRRGILGFEPPPPDKWIQ